MDCISRKDAMTKGLSRYFTGKPCKHGHVAERYTAHKRCVQCAHEKNTSQEAKQYNKEYSAKHADKARARSIAWFLDNKERAYSRRAKYIVANPDIMRASRRKWARNNPSVINALAAKRRASLRNALPIWLTKEHLWMIGEIYTLAAERNHTTGFAWHVDHIIPLQSTEVCGLHVPWNLRIVTQRTNQAKGNRYNQDQALATGDFSHAA